LFLKLYYKGDIHQIVMSNKKTLNKHQL